MLENLQNEKEKLIGQVVGIVYYNSDNGYTVCDIETLEDTVTAVGYMPQIAEGEQVTVFGEWTFHQDYGPQFKAEYYERTFLDNI